MRVTHVITRLIIGGAQENTIATVLGLRENPRFPADLIAGPTTGPEGSLESELAAHPGTLRILPSLVRPVSPWHDWRAWRKLIEIFRATRPGIVHTHSGKAGVLGRLAAHRAGVPIIVHTIHGPSFGPFQGRAANALFTAAERRAGRVTTHFVSVADAMTRQYLAAGIGRPEQYTRIFSGFSLGPFLAVPAVSELRARWKIAPDEFVVGKISRLFKLKGHDDLIDAAPAVLQRHPRTKFLLVGDGAWRGRLEARVRGKGLGEHFIFTGLVPPSTIPDYLGMMDVVAHLSRREGLPRALSQALAAGRPVVAFDCDGANEVCLSGRTGFLIAPGDTAALAGRLVELASEPALRTRLGAQGREFVRANFDVNTMARQIERLYGQLEKEPG